MRSTLLTSTLMILLCSLCATAADKTPRMISDLPPEARAGIRAQTDYSLKKGVWAQLGELSVTGSWLGYEIGTSVAISGEVVVVGTPYSSPSDAAYVYVKPPQGWGNLTQAAVLVPSDEQDNCANFGGSISISGGTVVVGASQSNPNCRSTGPGAVYVFVEPPGGWSGVITETAKLTASDGAVGDALGNSVSINGNAIAAGAPGTHPFAMPGSAYVFVEPANGWENSTETAKLTASDGNPYEEFGTSVSMSGSTIAVGAPLHASGTAYVFVEPPSGWANMTQTAELRSSPGTLANLMGQSVAIDGSTVVAGAPQAMIGSNQGQGAAYVFVEPPGGWKNMTQSALLLAPDGRAGDSLGSSVGISGDRVAVGAPYYSRGYILYFDYPAFWREGAVYVFARTGNSISVTKMNGADARYDDLLGTSVGISQNMVVSGAPYLGHYTGSAYVFGVR